MTEASDPKPPDRPPLSDEAKAAGHLLYQELYGKISEGFSVDVNQALEAINRLASPSIPASELIRAAMAEANYLYKVAVDEDDFATMEEYSPEPSARWSANADVVSLLQDAQIQLWEAEEATWTT
jgi:hypothetical protein